MKFHLLKIKPSTHTAQSTFFFRFIRCSSLTGPSSNKWILLEFDRPTRWTGADHRVPAAFRSHAAIWAFPCWVCPIDIPPCRTSNCIELFCAPFPPSPPRLKSGYSCCEDFATTTLYSFTKPTKKVPCRFEFRLQMINQFEAVVSFFGSNWLNFFYHLFPTEKGLAALSKVNEWAHKLKMHMERVISFEAAYGTQHSSHGWTDVSGSGALDTSTYSGTGYDGFVQHNVRINSQSNNGAVSAPPLSAHELDLQADEPFFSSSSSSSSSDSSEFTDEDPLSLDDQPDPDLDVDEEVRRRLYFNGQQLERKLRVLLRSSNCRVMLLYASSGWDARQVMRIASRLGMFEVGYVWLVSEQVLQQPQGLPDGLLGVRLSQRASDERAHIRDALRLIVKSIQQMSQEQPEVSSIVFS